MKWLGKIVNFLADAVGPDLHRYLQIMFLIGVGFMGYGIVSMTIRSASDRVCRWVKVDEQSRPARLVTLLASIGVTAVVLWAIYAFAPQLSPLHYMRF